MDILIKAFQTYYKLPESNKSFENLLVTLIKYHFDKGTIRQYTNPVEFEDSYELARNLAKNKQLQNLYDFSVYIDYLSGKIYTNYMFPEVIYIIQFLDHIFKGIHKIFKALDKALKSYELLELELEELKLMKKTLEDEYKNISSRIIDNTREIKYYSTDLNKYITTQTPLPDDIMNKLVSKQNLLKTQIQDLENKIDDLNSKKIKNRLDRNVTLIDKYINSFVINMDIITYLLFLNTETIPIELSETLNKQLKIKNTLYLTFLLQKFNRIIKENKICYITQLLLDEFKTFEQKIKKNILSSPTSPIKQTPISQTEEITSLITSKTISPKHKIEILFTNFIKLSEPIGASILYSILQKLGFGSRLT